MASKGLCWMETAGLRVKRKNFGGGGRAKSNVSFELWRNTRDGITGAQRSDQ